MLYFVVLFTIVTKSLQNTSPRLIFVWQIGYNISVKEFRCMNIMTHPNYFARQKQALIRENYNKIYAHELAHKQAGGNLAGSIVIEKNSDGIPFKGHVSIKMPSIDKTHPEKTIKDADTVIKSATAPSDPSEQDYKVAAQAKSIKSKAENIKNKKGLDYYA